ncbi:MAG: zinc chelation protein SecC [Gammaproteobacteria bacterium]|nr:zinc chelation protein SecC [Gammaproteobacteria bacterium]
MRSRYSAYALGDYGEYLLQTWLPSQNKSLSVANLSLQTATWVELEVLNSSEQGAEGFVEFNALFLGENGEICTHHERSLFQKILGKWLYVGEEI